MNNRQERNSGIIEGLLSEKNKLLDLIQSDTLLELDKEQYENSIESIDYDIKSLSRSFEELIQDAKSDILKLYLDKSDNKDWSVAWSGGKDSTAVGALLVSTIEEIPKELRNRKIHFIMSNTMVENPVLDSYMIDQVEKLKKYVRNKDLPITVDMVTRDVKNSYFYLILGRGYFLPQRNAVGRWCTDRLKVKPQQEHLNALNVSFQLTGVRLMESVTRRESINKFTIDSEIRRKISENGSIKNFMPIVDFTIEDVWDYLKYGRVQWSSTHEVRKLYRDATGECGFTNPIGTELKVSKSESCGARFGCWTCPVILKDKSTETMSNFNNWMKPLTRYRLLQLKVIGTEYVPQKPIGQNRKARSQVLKEVKEIHSQIKMITKSGYKRNGKRYTDKNGIIQDGKGTVTVEARKYLFNELMKTEYEVNRLRELEGLEKIQLIQDDEIELIKKNWEEDVSNSPWLITNAIGIDIKELDKLLNKLEEIENNQPIEL